MVEGDTGNVALELRVRIWHELAASGDGLDLPEVGRRFVAGEASAEELSLALMRARVFCSRGPLVGFLVGEVEDSRWVAVYSSETAIIAARGPQSWFCLPGHEVLERIPVGVGIVLDPDSAGTVLIPASSIRPFGEARASTTFEEN